MKDNKKYTFKAINYLFQTIKNHSFKINKLEPILYCPVTERMLHIIINNEAEMEGKPASISTSQFVKTLGQSRTNINRRLRFMAKYSLITCFNEWSIDKQGVKNIQKIRVNPKVKYILTTGAKASIILTCIKNFFTVAAEREESEADLQGFQWNIKFGDKEPKDIGDIRLKTTIQSYAEFDQSQSQAGDKILELIAKEDQAKAKRAKENKFWREKSDNFVQQAAVCWKRAQEKHGYGSAMPNWSGSPKDMPQQAKSERNELITTLKQYGGKVAVLSWYIYCAGVQEIDPKTRRPAYDNMNPHRQFITADRKPSQFTKHFNSLVASPDFRLYSKQKWADILPKLEGFFGDTLNLLPRDKMTEASNPTGIVPGDTGPTLEDLK